MPDTVPWYVTFGFGGPWGGHYTEIRVDASLSVEEQAMAANMAAFTHYDKNWGFLYKPEQFERSIKGFGMKLREVVTA